MVQQHPDRSTSQHKGIGGEHESDEEPLEVQSLLAGAAASGRR